MMFIFLLVMLFCSIPKVSFAQDSGGEFVEIKDAGAVLEQIATGINEKGGLAAVGEGISKRSDLAKDKARNDGLGKMVETLNQKISRLTKHFVEEVGGGQETEINETFSRVQKNIAINELKGAIAKESKLSKNNKTGQYMAAVLVTITPKVINQSIADEVKNSSPKLWERFRSSRAFDELQNETEKFEQSEQAKEIIQGQ